MNILAGFLAGIAASMGLGGGFVLIIYLTLFAGLGQTQAQAVNLLFFLPAALLSIIMHTKAGLIEWKMIPIAAAAGVFGALAGLFTGFTASEGYMRKLFGVLLLIVGLKELFHRKRQTAPKDRQS
ncbi:MAG: TSUP family transporter [Ruminiclostridium sp.]